GDGEGGAEEDVRHVAHLVNESGAPQQEGELGAIVRGNPARVGLKGHADELVGFDEPVGYRCFQMEVTGVIAAYGAESPAVDGTGHGHGTGHLIGDFRDGKLGGENQVAHVLHAEAEFGAGEGPAAEPALGTDVVDEVVVDQRVVHEDEGVGAVGVGPKVQGALRGGGIHARLAAAGDGQNYTDNQG